MKKYRLILGSASPRRVELLSLLELPFMQKVSSYDENLDNNLDPKIKCLELAKEKSKDIFSKLTAKEQKESFLITSDTVVYNKSKILEKPANKEEARVMLRDLENSVHTVFTSVFFRWESEKESMTKGFVEETQVEFGEIPERILEIYLNSKEPYDKAGAYGIQGTARIFIKKVNGCFSNVMGLPIYRVREELQNIFNEQDLNHYFY